MEVFRITFGKLERLQDFLTTGRVDVKLSDGSKVKMRVSPPCGERERLSSECARFLSDWLGWRDELKQTKKTDRSYNRKLEEMKRAEDRLKKARKGLNQHALREHACR